MSLWERAQLGAAASAESPAGAGSAAGRPDPLAALLNDRSISEVIANGPTEVWIERRGRLQRASLRFDDAEALRDTCVRLAARAGRRLDDAQPMVDARLADGSRLHAVLPPLAPDGPCLTIRRFAVAPIALADFGVDDASAAFLSTIVRAGWNIVVSGATSAGKTTCANALAQTIPAGERIVTIEETAELRLGLPHVVRLEARPANAEGAGAVSVRELVRAALRMRPDRLVVGEVRGGEAFDMLQALNTGHDGSLSTVHANSPADALARLETLVLLAGVALPLGAIRTQLAASVDVIVQVARGASGRRRIVAVAELAPARGTRSLAVRPLLVRAHSGLTAVEAPTRPARRAGVGIEEAWRSCPQSSSR